jgi:hypothetical protein
MEMNNSEEDDYDYGSSEDSPDGISNLSYQSVRSKVSLTDIPITGSIRS